MRKSRAFLKWAGGKYGLVEEIQQLLPEGETLVEPFVGAGSVFLNTDYSRYILNDINHDLISLYRIVQTDVDAFIADARTLFTAQNNSKAAYYAIRQQFNETDDPYQRALLFLYLNRHGYNGLCRYNKKGGFNVPFGSYKAPYFPERELLFFAEKAQRATFHCEAYPDAFARAAVGDVIYCDPPYAPLSPTASFTNYHNNGFGLEDQRRLAEIAHTTAVERGICTLISNHDVPLTRELYQRAQLRELKVKRTISRNGYGRSKVGELLALYLPGEALAEARARPAKPSSVTA